MSAWLALALVLALALALTLARTLIRTLTLTLTPLTLSERKLRPTLTLAIALAWSYERPGKDMEMNQFTLRIMLDTLLARTEPASNIVMPSSSKRVRIRVGVRRGNRVTMVRG